MRAIVYSEYGSRHFPRLADLPKPTVGDGDLVTIPHATGVVRAECH